MSDLANKPTNYTAAQEQIIRDAIAKAGKGNLDLAKRLAADPAMVAADGKERNYRSIVAKIGRMELPYERKEPTAKDGSAITKKSDLVTRIAAVVDGNFDGLDKAPKAALVAIAAYVERADAERRDSEADIEVTLEA